MMFRENALQPWHQLWQVWLLASITLILLYLALVRILRFRRMHKLARPYKLRGHFANMTVTEASTIQNQLIELEFPFLYLKSLEFALFKTYGIPTNTSLLVKTRQLLDPLTAPKRYVDTVVLIREFCINPPGSERYREAIARMNFIHSIYQKNDKILNSDLLYTLGLFALEPIRWIAKHDWRGMTDVERCAIGTFWKQIGDDMQINYHELHGNDVGWKDGIEWLESVEAWNLRYEEQAMVPHPDNKATADKTTGILLWAFPKFLHPLGLRVISTLLEDRLRTAIMYDKPPKLYFPIINALLYLRKKTVRYLALPRPNFLRVSYLEPEKNKHGRYNINVYEYSPVYIKPSWSRRLSPQAWVFWLLGKPVPGDEVEGLHPEGYHITEVGPDHMVKLGRGHMEATKRELGSKDMRKCPFAM